MMSIKKFALCMMVVFMLVMALTGCAFLDTVQELKGEPEVMDVSIIMKGDAVHVDVILREDTNIADASALAEKYTAIVKRYYAKEDIHVSMTVPYRDDD